MKTLWMIVTLCGLLLGSAFAQSFDVVATPEFATEVYSTVAWGDVDNNGYPDLFCGASGDAVSQLYLNSGSGWSDGAEWFDFPSITNVRTARLVDYNQDGLLDLFCLTSEGDGVALYRQTESRRFQPVALDLDGQTDEAIRAAVWCDADLDGNLDLLLSNRSTDDQSTVLLVPSDESMIEVRGADGPFAETDVLQISAVDFDQDGDLDYFMSKGDGSTSLWVQRDGGYSNYSDYLWFPTKIATTGITWADFDRNGTLDLFASGSSKDNCMYYQGDGNNVLPCSFDNVSEQTGLRALAAGAVDAHAVDVNADGRTDLFLNCETDNKLVFNTADGWEAAPRHHALIQPGLMTTGSAWADFDRDGDLDVALISARGGVRLYSNQVEQTREYIGLNLCSAQGTAPLMNCLVKVQFESGKQWAATSMYTASVGADEQTVLLYNPSWYHSEQWVVSVAWPNGMVTELTQDDLPLNANSILCMPLVPLIEAPNQGVSLAAIPDINNYPNPFNPTTQIEFKLDAAAEITLSVFNLLGQEVAVLARGTYDAGQHSLAFDAAALPSGLYLARLDTPAGSVVHRMLLTK
ncbi:MAG: T9SS type A sorting domain-containing protein [bacterium]|nr:T9SS type A sorting domain-containing protein [bacterium]